MKRKLSFGLQKKKDSCVKIVIIRKLFCVAIYRDLVIAHQGIRISVFIKGNIAPELPLEEALCIFILISIYVTDRTVCLIDRSALVPSPHNNYSREFAPLP